MSGQRWTLTTQPEQLKTGLVGKRLLKSHLWCPDDLASLWDILDETRIEFSILLKLVASKMFMMSSSII